MRKFILAAVALAVIAGAAAYVMACDQGKTNASAANASSCPGAKASATSCPAAKNTSTVLTGSGGCPMSKSGAANADAGCSAHQGATAAGGACPAGSMACCKDGAKCANYVIAVADMDDCCAAKVEKALSGVKNVKAVYVDAEAHKAWVCTGKDKFDSKAAVKSVQKAGFKQVKYAGVDNEHCVHEMKTAAAKAAS
jgi:copper chaperone CopZ